jgi:type I restriction enzyme, S subunit
MKPMELRAGYKNTEIGIIPEDWEIDIIKNLSVIKTGSRNTQDRVENGLFPFFVRSQTVERINTYSFDGEAVLTAGDGVGVGKVIHYVNEKFDCHQRVYRISNFSDRINGFYFYLYFCNNFLNRIMQMTAKSSVDSVRMDMIANMQVPIPPTTTEQTAIATALSDADALINSLEKLIAKKRNIKQGAMQKLLQPKEDWEAKKLGEIADIVGGGTPSSFIPSYWNGTINWFTPTEIGESKYTFESIRKITKEGFINCSGKMLPIGTILLTTRAGIGDLSILMREGCTNQGFQSLIAKEGFFNEYLYYLMQTLKNVLIQNASGSTFLEISPNKIKQIEVSIPSFQEQTRIATILSDMDNEITALETKLEKYRKVKLGMMQNLLTGKIRLV